jgi:hypothetical protein
MPHAPAGVLTFEQVLVALLHPPNRQLRRSIRRSNAGERIGREYRRILTV